MAGRSEDQKGAPTAENGERVVGRGMARMVIFDVGASWAAPARNTLW